MKKTEFLFLLILTVGFLENRLYAQHIPQLLSLTQNGGAEGSGALFHYTPTTNEQVVDFSWPNSTPGQVPGFNNLTQGTGGKFYGMTSGGGAKNRGVIFEWDMATNSYSRKIDFDGVNGSVPYGSLTSYNGKFYGMTRVGGDINKGVIFEWDPATNIYARKIDFNATDGSEPCGSLTLYKDKFYGMTSLDQDETNGKGVIFEWDPSTNIYTKKIDFNGIDGSNPFGDLTLSGGKFYGMTVQGGTDSHGVIFEWDPSSNSYTKKIDLTANDGGYPFGSLTFFNEKFYGMSLLGGTSYQGVIFEWDPVNNTYLKKIDFIGTNGERPLGSLTLLDGKFYGTTETGGGPGVTGIIFEWNPSTNDFTKKFGFDYGNGAYPQGSLTLADGKFYGMTRNGGFNRVGVIFEWDPATNKYFKRIDFDNTVKGGYPTGSLAYRNGKFYGMTYRGGANGTGVIFEWNPYTATYTKKIDFIEINGHYPTGDLTFYNGKFYGMTSTGGGVENGGVIFEWDPSTNIYSHKFIFTPSSGRNPLGSLTLYNGKFYGMTQHSGANDRGVIFEWAPTTNAYVKKFDFEIINTGREPIGSLTLFDNKFYGVAGEVIFEWDPLTNNYSKKIDFDGTNGRNPVGAMVQVGGKFYGMTYYGGSAGLGVIFEWNPADNTLNKKIDFDGANRGSTPYGSLFYSGDKFYGMTTAGGVNGYGVIFEWDPITNVYSKKVDFNAANGANPQYSQFIEVLSNQAPVVSNLPGTQKKCVKTASGSVNFTVADSDDDIQVFTVSSSNEKLLVGTNISIAHLNGNEYKISYAPEATVTGSSIITIISKDGHDGEASFNFEVTVNPEKPVVEVDLTDLAAPLLTSNGKSGNQWYLNGSEIAGATEKTFVVKNKGIYQVSVTVENCTSLLSEGKTFIITGDVQNEMSERANLYPNPVHDLLTIQLAGFKENDDVNVMLVDGIGRAITRQTGKGGKDLIVDVKNYVSGPYFILMTQGTIKQQAKFIKK